MTETSQQPDIPLITRRLARERAMQVLFAYDVSREPIEILTEQIAGKDLNDDPDTFTFAQNLIYTTLQRRPELDVLIQNHALNWDFERIALLDRIILRMGVCEFLYFPEIPVKVTIDEWVEIAKMFSTEQSGRFVNGMLDSMLSSLRKDDRVRKAGRGLLGT